MESRICVALLHQRGCDFMKYNIDAEFPRGLSGEYSVVLVPAKHFSNQNTWRCTSFKLVTLNSHGVES